MRRHSFISAAALFVGCFGSFQGTSRSSFSLLSSASAAPLPSKAPAKNARKPAAKISPKPAPKPASKPSGKPVAKPASKLAAKPVSKPAVTSKEKPSANSIANSFAKVSRPPKAEAPVTPKAVGRAAPRNLAKASPPAAGRRTIPLHEKARFGTGVLSWPLRGVLYSRFGKQGGVEHDGIDLAAPVGTPVRAAAAGTVLFAGRQRAYGLIVIIEHDNGLVTIYAHNKELHVQSQQKVAANQVIASVGHSGRTTGPHLHFEVRHNGFPIDPLQLFGEVPSR